MHFGFILSVTWCKITVLFAFHTDSLLYFFQILYSSCSVICWHFCNFININLNLMHSIPDWTWNFQSKRLWINICTEWKHCFFFGRLTDLINVSKSKNFQIIFSRFVYGRNLFFYWLLFESKTNEYKELYSLSISIKINLFQ